MYLPSEPSQLPLSIGLKHNFGRFNLGFFADGLDILCIGKCDAFNGASTCLARGSVLGLASSSSGFNGAFRSMLFKAAKKRKEIEKHDHICCPLVIEKTFSVR